MVIADAENKLVECTAICNCTNGKKAQILSENVSNSVFATVMRLVPIGGTTLHRFSYQRQ